MTSSQGLTFNEHVNAALQIAHEARSLSSSSSIVEEERAEHTAAARDLSISITHLEDALTRYNSARYHQKNIWKRADPDRS